MGKVTWREFFRIAREELEFMGNVGGSINSRNIGKIGGSFWGFSVVMGNATLKDSPMSAKGLSDLQLQCLGPGYKSLARFECSEPVDSGEVNWAAVKRRVVRKGYTIGKCAKWICLKWIRGCSGGTA